MPVLELFDQVDEKQYSILVTEEEFSRVVKGEDLNLASFLLEKEKEKRNFIAAYKIMQAPASEASTSTSTRSNQERGISFVEEECNLENGDIENFSEGLEGKIWNAKMLIALCKKFNDQFETGVKKHIWKKISSELTKNCQRMYTYQQCDTKFKVLKNMYKSVRKYNSQSGNNKKSWEYYGLMDDIMFNKPEICPVATCSSARGLITNGLQEQDTNIEVSRPSACSTPLSARELDENSTTTNVMRKRKHYENATERRHQEKMSRQDRYLSRLERITVAVERSSTTS